MFLIMWVLCFGLFFEVSPACEGRALACNSDASSVPDGTLLGIGQVLLPQTHPLQPALKRLFADPKKFSSQDAWEQAGFVMKWDPLNVNATTIFVVSHPSIPGYLIKKYPDSVSPSTHLERYMKRIRGAAKIAEYIGEHGCLSLAVPKKWLYRLSGTFPPDHLLIVEDMDVCEGGWWGGETLERYRTMDKRVLHELCLILYDLRGCDAWPQNQPFTRSGKIAFIDTEHLGASHGDFLERTIQFIPPGLVDYALRLWRWKENSTAHHLD